MKKCIISTIIIAIITSIFFAVYIHQKWHSNNSVAYEGENKYRNYTNIINNVEHTMKETSSVSNKTTPNTRLVEKKYYIDCGHLVRNEEKMPQRLVNKDESEFQIEYIGWEIQKFNPNEVDVYKEIYDFCNEHYLVKDVEGEIIIYGLDKYDNEVDVIRETGIQTKYLSEEDIQNLKKGIKVCGNKELNTIIEDYE